MIADGDHQSLADLMKLFKGRSNYLSRTILKDSSLSDDILSEVIVKIWKHAEKIANLKNPKAYIDVMLYNTTLNLVKMNADQELNYDIPCRVSYDDQLLVDQILINMDKELRTALILHAVYGYTIGEISKILNLSFKQTRLRIQKAKKEFIKAYQKEV
jgi:DNA-directed RNA polymerase specialized sigma24 family protein